MKSNLFLYAAVNKNEWAESLIYLMIFFSIKYTSVDIIKKIEENYIGILKITLTLNHER